MKNVKDFILGKLYLLEMQSSVNTNSESKLKIQDKLNLIREFAVELEVLNEEVARVINEIQVNINR